MLETKGTETAPKPEPKYSIIEDLGKPDRIEVQGDAALKTELKRFYLITKSGEYPHADLTVYNEDGNDISESQFINEMIGDIVDEDKEGSK